MTILADTFASFLGSIWFALLLGAVGYIAGNLFPLNGLFKKN